MIIHKRALLFFAVSFLSEKFFNQQGWDALNEMQRFTPCWQNFILHVKHIVRPHCTCCELIAVIFFRYPAPPAASAAYGQPPQSPYNTMASPAPPPTQQLTNQMSAMNLGNYGKFSILFTNHSRQVIVFIDCSISVEEIILGLEKCQPEYTHQIVFLHFISLLCSPRSHAEPSSPIELCSPAAFPNIPSSSNGPATDASRHAVTPSNHANGGPTNGRPTNGRPSNGRHG